MHFVRLCVYLVWLEYGLVEVWEAGSSCPSHVSVPPVLPQADHCRLREEHTVSATKLMHCLDMHLKTNQQTNKVLTHA